MKKKLREYTVLIMNLRSEVWFEKVKLVVNWLSSLIG